MTDNLGLKRAKARAASARYRAAHPEKLSAGQTRYRAAHPDKSRAASARYRAAHPQEVKAAQTNYRRSEKAKVSARLRYAADPKKAKEISLKKNLRHCYGMSLAEYNSKLKAQNGVCAICLREPTGRRLGVDHDHKTGKNRGLLCNPCNTALGFFQEEPAVFIRAISYLQSHAD